VLVRVVADIPGLIEGAHRNRGLGFSFLRHIERCQCIVYVIDLAHSDPTIQLATLWDELERFEPGLSRRPHIILGNKLDLPGAELRAVRLQEFLQDSGHHRDSRFLTVSAKRSINIKLLLQCLRELYDQHHPAS
jgi:GTPase